MVYREEMKCFVLPVEVLLLIRLLCISSGIINRLRFPFNVCTVDREEDVSRQHF